jgi:hypothetical protein
MKPYAINLVNLSKWNGGGNRSESGMSKRSLAGFFLSSSWISMAKKSSSLLGPSGFRTAFSRMDVSVCATVSAIPPSMAFVIIVVRTE